MAKPISVMIPLSLYSTANIKVALSLHIFFPRLNRISTMNQIIQDIGMNEFFNFNYIVNSTPTVNQGGEEIASVYLKITNLQTNGVDNIRYHTGLIGTILN